MTNFWRCPSSRYNDMHPSLVHFVNYLHIEIFIRVLTRHFAWSQFFKIIDYHKSRFSLNVPSFISESYPTSCQDNRYQYYFSSASVMFFKNLGTLSVVCPSGLWVSLWKTTQFLNYLDTRFLVTAHMWAALWNMGVLCLEVGLPQFTQSHNLRDLVHPSRFFNGIFFFFWDTQYHQFLRTPECFMWSSRCHSLPDSRWNKVWLPI